MIPALLLVAQLAAVGSIEGRVTSVVGDAPVAGAAVAVDSLDLGTTTDADGAFRLTGLPGGRWTLRIAAEGFEPRTVVARVPAEGSVRLDFALRPVPRPADSGPDRRPARLVGVVRERGRLEPVRYALVEAADGRGRALTDEDGYFTLEAPPGRTRITVQASGYRTADSILDLAPGRAERVSLLLEPAPLPVDGVLVPAERLVSGLEVQAPEALVMDSVLLDMVPTTVERDVLRGLQVLPAVTPSSDYSSALFVRGGTPDQTRILLDGAVVHNPYHVGGFVSAFAPSATAAAILRPGALPASAPSTLSGVLEIQTRDGGRDSVRVNGSVGLLTSHATVDGPWAGGEGAWLVSARRTYVDVATGAARSLGLIDDRVPYGFWDVHGKLTRDLGATRSVSLSTYLNREGLLDPDDEFGEEARWGSDLVSLRYRGLEGSRVLLEGGVSTSGFGIDIAADPASPDPTAIRGDLRTWTGDASLRVEVGRHTLFAGGRLERTAAEHDLRGQGSYDDFFPTARLGGDFGSLGLFVRDRWALFGPVVVDAGVRAVRPLGRSWRLLPRGRLSVDLGGGTRLALGGGRYVQDGWSLRNEESVFASIIGYDLPVATPADRPLRDGWDAVLDARWRTSGWEMRAEAFVKRLEHLPTAPVSADPLDAVFLQAPEDVTLGELDVRGVEFLAAGRLGGATLSGAYRFQHERRRLNGTSFTPRTNRPHRIVLAGSRPFGEREAAVALTWMSGLAYTPVVARLPVAGGVDAEGRVLPYDFVELDEEGRPLFRDEFPTLVLGEPNSRRLSSYLRLDVDLRGAWDWTLFGRRGVLEPYVSVLNLLGSKNVLYADYRQRFDGGEVELGPQLPILPSFGVRWRF